MNCGPKGPSRCFISQNLCLLGWAHSTGPPSERTKARWFCTVPTLPTGNVGHLAHDTPEGREPLFALPSQAAPTSLSPLDSFSGLCAVGYWKPPPGLCHRSALCHGSPGEQRALPPPSCISTPTHQAEGTGGTVVTSPKTGLAASWGIVTGCLPLVPSVRVCSGVDCVFFLTYSSQLWGFNPSSKTTQNFHLIFYSILFNYLFPY